MRLFLAIRPPRAVLDHLEPAFDGVRDRAGRALCWTEPEQRHLTLAFHPEAVSYTHLTLPTILLV